MSAIHTSAMTDSKYSGEWRNSATMAAKQATMAIAYVRLSMVLPVESSGGKPILSAGTKRSSQIRALMANQNSDRAGSATKKA